MNEALAAGFAKLARFALTAKGILLLLFLNIALHYFLRQMRVHSNIQIFAVFRDFFTFMHM